MPKFRNIATAAALLLAIGVACYQTKRASSTSDDVQKLRAQQAQLVKQISDLQESLTNKDNQIADLLAENSRLKKNPNQTELLKLRGEVTRLRPLQDDVVALQKMLQRSGTGLPAWKTDEIRDAGRATPIDAVQTYLYSALRTNAVEVQNSLVGDDADPPSAEDLQNFINDRSNHPEVADAGVAGFKILSETWLATDKIEVELSESTGNGVGVSVPVILRNINGEWKMVVFNIRDQFGKFLHVGFPGKLNDP